MSRVALAIAVIVWLVASPLTAVDQNSPPRLRIMFSDMEANVVTVAGYALIANRQQPLVLTVDSADPNAFRGAVVDLGFPAMFMSSRLLADGSVVAVGRLYRQGQGYDVLVARLGRENEILWTRTIGGEDFDAGEDVLDVDGSLVVVGYSYSFSKIRSSDVLLLKLDYSGTILGSWTIGVEAYDDIAHRIERTRDGRLLILGETKSYNVSLSDILLVKMDANVQVQWSASIGGSSFEKAVSAVETDEAGLFVVGVSESFPMGKTDGFFLEVDKNGRLKYVKGVGWSGSDGFKDVCFKDGKYYVLGYSSVRKEEGDLLFLEVNSLGSVAAAYILTRSGFDSPHSVNPLGNNILATAAFSESETEALILESYSVDWSNITLEVFSQVKPMYERLDFMRISNINDSVTLADWTLRQVDLTVRSVDLAAKEVPAAVSPLTLNHQSVQVTVGEYVERTDWVAEAIRFVESNIPIIILAIPFITFFIAWLLLKIGKIVRRRTKS